MRGPPCPFKNSSLVEWLLLSQGRPGNPSSGAHVRLDGNVDLAPGNLEQQASEAELFQPGPLAAEFKMGHPLRYPKNTNQPRERQLLLLVPWAPTAWSQRYSFDERPSPPTH